MHKKPFFCTFSPGSGKKTGFFGRENWYIFILLSSNALGLIILSIDLFGFIGTCNIYSTWRKVFLFFNFTILFLTWTVCWVAINSKTTELFHISAKMLMHIAKIRALEWHSMSRIDRKSIQAWQRSSSRHSANWMG